MSEHNSTKLQIINLLKKRGQWVSGESVSRLLGISRAAVGKHVAALRAEGYLIQALSRRGYLLKAEPDAININAIKKSLATRIIGQGQWYFLEKTPSTNTQAALLAMEGAPEGSLVLAGLQTEGKGRKGRGWFSAPRGIHFSVLLKPPMPARRLSLLSLLACLAVQKTYADLSGLDVRIKWPNDIIIGLKKVAAVLVEASIVGGEVEWAIVGIGCNLNSTYEEFPENLRVSASSLLQETGKTFSRNLVYKELINNLDFYYCKLLQEGGEPLVFEWKQKSDIIGKELRLTAGGQVVEGKALKLDQDGLLVIADKTGRQHQMEVGDYSEKEV